MRPLTAYEAAHAHSSNKAQSNLRLRPRRRSLIGRSRAMTVGSLRQRSDDEGDEQLIISIRDRASVNSQTGAPLQTNGQALQEYLMVLAPQRLLYEIQMASGWDQGFPPEELVGLMRTSTGKGWHTPRFCSYPQDLVLRFSCGKSRIRKIQILSHQYKIASRLDFWMGSRKGAQSINTGDNGTQPNDETHRELDSVDRERSNALDEVEDGLDLAPQMEVRKKSLPVLQFQKLGSISFDSNTESNYSKRELKSINVDVEGEYLRVVIRQCHVNPLNIYHQVAILALNVLGEPLEDELHGESERLHFDDCEVVNGPGHGLSEPSTAYSLNQITEIPEVPNLSEAVNGLTIVEIQNQPQIYLDQDVQRLLFGFVKAKQDAVKVEDFASAKLYKAGHDKLLKFADEIQALDIEKQRAADNDEFDLAQELKAKVAEVKARMNKYMSLSGFHIISNEDSSIVSLTAPEVIEDEQHSDKSNSTSRVMSTYDLYKSIDMRNASGSSIEIHGQQISVDRRRIPPAATLNRTFSAASDSSDAEKVQRGSYSVKSPASLLKARSRSSETQKEYIETTSSAFSSIYSVTPLFKGNPKDQQLNSLGIADDNSDGLNTQAFTGYEEINSIQLNELTEQEQVSFAASLEAFPRKVISCLLNRELQLRLYAIEYVKEHLENENASEDTDHSNDWIMLARAAFQVISIVLSDTREKVVTLALALLDQTVKFSLQNEVPSSVAYRSLEPIFSQLLVKASDLNTRVVQGTLDRIVMLCNSFRSSPYAILPLVFKPAKSTVLYRQARSRIEIVVRLVDEFGVFDRKESKGTPGGLNFENITEFAIPYLSHTNGEVRIAARKLIIDVCKFLAKTRVEQFLPGVKPLIIESIQKELIPKFAKKVPLAPLSSQSRPAAQSTSTTQVSSRLPMSTSTPTSGTNKRRQAPVSIGVNLHMDSLKSLLVEPGSPGLARTSRQSSRQRSDAAMAHQARLKMPLKSSAKAQHAVYTGVPRLVIKKQATLSPDDENDSTASEDIKPLASRATPISYKATTRPLQSRSKSGSSLSTREPRHGIKSENLSGSDTQKGPEDVSRSVKDRFCVFCDEHNNAFTDEGLIAHYWNDCAMLANCAHCKIIIEIPTLADHMLNECSKRKFVKQCETCKEIMAADTFLAHVAAGCFAVPEATTRCPLCLLILPSNDEIDWKEHLLTGQGCPKSKKSPKNQKPSAPLLRRTTSILPPVNTSSARRYTASTAPIALTASPTSPLSSSSLSSTRINSTSSRYRGNTVSAAESPASSVASFVMEGTKASIPQCNASSVPYHIQRAPLQLQQGYLSGIHQNQPHQESIHPLDPIPGQTNPDLTTFLTSPPLGAQSLHQSGSAYSNSGSNNSRIPKLGIFRSASSNSVSSMAWK
ncbi:hypothetical protein BX616_005733 [Lobosporangium transversale]|uniref:TOG domain-containing protein n=1 Tax=Lobosporangium transversale TaxID=64571 RepID=A0A1Y2G6K6_9FUNG|nr:hypothetical protein BCR41DRAFT_390515 [Lobosporangium transversale]KAF9915612.1 hypothetical protein BX616_005733 [Lobosporangium transversale]ORY98358.1 hypothetical protein BCR41DRAFT_390515 [Lobosporangium transversale]|eukprot:XP_021875750.1 hypothetical protein BCR41DRAFT_390515 [Lobosporangium transversale]